MNQGHHRVPLVEVRDLMAPGEPLPFRVFDSMGRLLLAAGQRVLGVRQLQALLERGACVEYLEAAAARKERAAAAAGRSLTPSARKRTLFDRWEQQTWALDALLRRLGHDGALAPQIEAFADDHLALIDRHPDVALFMCIHQEDCRFALYGLNHALHTATVAAFCSRQLGWDAQRVRCLVRAALTMNVSMLELQAQMAEQKDPPTRKQLEEIRSHPQRSAQALRDAGVADAEWLDAVESHHEQPGGGGYPRGLQEVSDLVHVLRAGDVFMAKVSPRALRAALQPQVAALQLFQGEHGGPVAAALIKAVGVHPPGDYVRLRSGEAAIVVQRTDHGNTPIVAALADTAGHPVRGAPRRDTSTAAYAITGPVTDRKALPRVFAEQLYGLLDA